MGVFLQVRPANEQEDLPPALKLSLLFANDETLREEGVKVNENIQELPQMRFNVGAAALITAIAASFSGGYALFTVFKSQQLATLFGIFYGLTIFNIDRLLVVTTRKDKQQSWQHMAPTIIRLFAAVLPYRAGGLRGSVAKTALLSVTTQPSCTVMGQLILVACRRAVLRTASLTRHRCYYR